MIRILLSSAFGLCLAASGLTQTIPGSAVWPLPPVPAGANPITVPMAREDWVVRVQDTLTQNKGKHFDLVFDGDSITDYWRTTGKEIWNQRFGTLNAVDFGIAGDRVEHLLWRLNQGQVDGIDPKLVVLMIGTNNSAHNSPDQIAGGIKVAVDEYLKRCPRAHILLLAVFPRGSTPTHPARGIIAEINKQIARLQSDRVTFLDIGSKLLEPDGTLSKEIMPDLLHPSAKGYQIWADAIQPVVDKYLIKQTAL